MTLESMGLSFHKCRLTALIQIKNSFLPVLMSTPALQEFARLLHEKTREQALSKSCSKGVWVFHEGDGYQGPWVLHNGSVVLVKSSSGGKEQIVRQVESGELFAEVPLFKEVEWYPVSARCASACELSLIPKAWARTALQSDPSLSWKAACALSDRVAEFRDAIFDLTLADARQRLLRYFLKRLDGSTNPSLGVVRLGIPHQDLALLLGIRPESLSRALSELEQSGKIKRLSRQSFQLFPANILQSDREL